MPLAILAHWDEASFGRDKESAADIESRWLIYDEIPLGEFYNDYDALVEQVRYFKTKYAQGKKPDRLQLVPVKDEMLPSGEYVGVSQLYWIKLVQRTWKKQFQKREEVLRLRKNPFEIIDHERNGKWSVEASHLPTLRGMLA
jgi:hypothetical protein